MAEVPKPKPLTEDQFKNELDLTAKIIFNKTLPKDDLRITLQEKIKKGEDAGIMSSEEALSFIKDRMEFFKDYAKENPMGDPPPKNFQMGGRVDFLKGGDTKYNAMVTEMYIKLGGKEGTGMDIDTFAEEYFKKFSTGGRVNYKEGSDYFDEQKTMTKQKTKTGPIKGGKTPQIPTEDFEKYQKFKKEKKLMTYAAEGGRIGYDEGGSSMDPDTLKLQAKVKEIMDIEGLDFGEAFKKALREIKAEARDISD